MQQIAERGASGFPCTGVYDRKQIITRNKNESGRDNGMDVVLETNLWHFVPMKAAIMLQYSQADGLPYCFTLYSHFLHMVDVLPLL